MRKDNPFTEKLRSDYIKLEEQAAANSEPENTMTEEELSAEIERLFDELFGSFDDDEDELEDEDRPGENKSEEKGGSAAEDDSDETLDNIITLTSEDGSDVHFEFLDLIEYESDTYVVLLPENETEDGGEVVILKVEESALDADKETYVSVEDEAVLMAVFEIFRQKFRDEFDFVD